MKDFHESMDGTGQTPAGFYGYEDSSARPTHTPLFTYMLAKLRFFSGE